MHELLHAKQAYWKAYAKENKNNKNLTEDERNALKEYLKLNNISKKNEEDFKGFIKKYTENDVKNNEELAKKYKELYSKYSNAVKEVDADNVSLALQSSIGNAVNVRIREFLGILQRNENRKRKVTTREIAEIMSFIDRARSNQFGFGRLSDNVDTRTFYQDDVNQDKNLLMTHSARVERLDDILESGSLVAPSMAITKKGEKSLNFGGVVFVRNPEKINFNEDNIYDRDIYSPRLPQADYETADGYFVNAYDYESMERLWKNHPERFKQNYGGKTFEEYFKGAEKVLWLGFSPSGKRRYAPYTAENIIKEMKKDSLLNGEMWGFGLSSFLAQLAKKQTSLKALKKTAKTQLGKVENEVMKKLKDQYGSYESALRAYAKDEYKSFSYFDGIYPDILKAI